jgi:hypothetical protein
MSVRGLYFAAFSIGDCSPAMPRPDCCEDELSAVMARGKKLRERASNEMDTGAGNPCTIDRD